MDGQRHTVNTCTHNSVISSSSFRNWSLARLGVAQFLRYWQIFISTFRHDFMSEASLYFGQSSLTIFTMMCLTEARYELVNHFCLDTLQIWTRIAQYFLYISQKHRCPWIFFCNITELDSLIRILYGDLTGHAEWFTEFVQSERPILQT